MQLHNNTYQDCVSIVKGLITLCVVSLAFFIFPCIFYCSFSFIFPHVFLFSSRFFIFPHVFYFSSLFSSRFGYHVGIKNVMKNARKLPNARKTQEHFSILHYALGNNASLLRFYLRFCSQTLPKCNPNAKCNMGLRCLCFIFQDDACYSDHDEANVAMGKPTYSSSVISPLSHSNDGVQATEGGTQIESRSTSLVKVT